MRDDRFAPENAHRNNQHNRLHLSPHYAIQNENENEMTYRRRERY